MIIIIYRNFPTNLEITLKLINSFRSEVMYDNIMYHLQKKNLRYKYCLNWMIGKKFRYQ